MDKARVNPFVSRTGGTTSEKIYLVLGLIILFPIRLLIFVFISIITSIIGLTLVLVMNALGLQNVLAINSKLKLWTLKLIYSNMALAAYLVGIRVKVVDKRTEEERHLSSGITITLPHCSHLGFLPYVYSSHLLIPVTKKESITNLLTRGYSFLVNPILFSRYDAESKRRAIAQIGHRSKSEMVQISPEGTMTNGKLLPQFKIGAFLPGIPVNICMDTLNYSGSINRVNLTWIGPKLLTMWALTMASWTPIGVTLTYKTYYPSDEEKKCPALYAENVRQFVAKELGIHCSRYSNEEALLLDWAIKANISLSSSSLKLAKITYKLSKFNKTTIYDNNKELRGNSCQVWTHKLVFNYIITNTINKLNSFNLSQSIDSYEEMFSLIDLPFKVELEDFKSAFEDFFSCLHLNVNQKITVANLTVFLQLANSDLGNIKQRVKAAFLLLAKSDLSENDSMKIILWYLVGLEEFQIDENIINGIKTFSDDLIEKLTIVCKEAMQDNCAHLIKAL